MKRVVVHISKQYISTEVSKKILFFCCLSLMLVLFLSSVSFAAVVTGNITLRAFTNDSLALSERRLAEYIPNDLLDPRNDNTSAEYNLSNILTNALGKIKYNGYSPYKLGMKAANAPYDLGNEIYTPVIGIASLANTHMSLRDVGLLSPRTMPVSGVGGRLWTNNFLDNFLTVPNITYVKFDPYFVTYDYYYYLHYADNTVNATVIPFVFSNSTSSGVFFGALYINFINTTEVHFQYKFNNQSGNNTFGRVTGCQSITTEAICVTNSTCSWKTPLGICAAIPNVATGGVANDIQAPGCGTLPQGSCFSINQSVCTWNENASLGGLCQQASGFNPTLGIRCQDIINVPSGNQTLCNNQHFTEKTGLCSWDGTTCLTNTTKTKANITQSTVYSCEAPSVLTNRTACELMATRYFLPCGFNNATNKCASLFIDYKEIERFETISSEQTCLTQSGIWRTETTFDPNTGQLTSENWCEFGTYVKPFSAVGTSGGFGLGGTGSNQLNDCNSDCFACEFNSSARWPDATTAEAQCQASAKGCSFRVDTNAFNGFGWCAPANEFGGFDCNKFCGDCNLVRNPESACQNSTVSGGCKWDNLTRICMGAATKSCGQECFSCGSQTTCTTSNASSGCQWDSTLNFCKPQGGDFEICFDGIDNNNNGNIDCKDAKCNTDPFCGGSVSDVGNCAQHEPYKYGGSIVSARGNCTNVARCLWMEDQFGFARCVDRTEQCFTNASLQTDVSACNNLYGGNTCKFSSHAFCSHNDTKMRTCFGAAGITQAACQAIPGCAWNTNSNFCDFQPLMACNTNASLQTSEDACNRAGCAWAGNTTTTFEGHFSSRINCVSPCENPKATTQAACSANATFFGVNACTWNTGHCDPFHFVGGCFENEGDVTNCRKNSNCVWMDVTKGPVRHPNGTTIKTQYITTDQVWMAIGSDHPNVRETTGGENVSLYRLNKTNGAYIRIAMTNGGIVAGIGANISLLQCSLVDVMRYSWTNKTCLFGTCDAYNATTCNGTTLHYYMNTTTRQLEALWEVDISNLTLDASGRTNNNLTTNTVNISTVIVDGSLQEHINETLVVNKTNTRVRTARGWCMDKVANTFFAGIEDNPPIELDRDATTAGGPYPYVDLANIGLKKTNDAYLYGIGVQNIAGSSICNNVPLSNGLTGTGTNTSKYYLYVDSDGNQRAGCSSDDPGTATGFEYLFKYVAETDATGQLVETFLSQHCVNGVWVATNIPVRSDKFKSCSIINGPILAVDKTILNGKSDVDVNKGWRVYVTSANGTGNSTNVYDKMGPSMGDFRSIDFMPVDCTNPEHKDNSKCTKFKQFGFFPGEFGPACKDTKDNDADGSTDCDDNDCVFDPFFCGGTFRARADDSSAPSVSTAKINNKIPTEVAFIFGTNEPAKADVIFYNNDSRCVTVNTTSYDFTLNNTDTFDDYRNHHVATITGLAANKTYYYKYHSCDVTGNCAVSACTNVTTAVTHSNITFKLALPTGWTADIPALNLTNFSAQYALKTSTENLNDINISVLSPNNKTSVTLVGVDIFETQTLNLSGFGKGTNDDFIGIDSNQYQSFKQRTGMDSTIIRIETNATSLQHCDDSGENCQDVSDKVSCTFGATKTECNVADAVGLGFSAYKAASPSGGGGGAAAAAGVGGGGAGRGGHAKTTEGGGVSTEKTWTTAVAGSELTMKITNPSIAVTSLVVSIRNTLSYFKIAVKSMADPPIKAKALDGIPYQYLEISKQNAQDTDLSAAEIAFDVKDSWTAKNKVDPQTVGFYRWSNNQWQKLSTTYVGVSDKKHHYKSTTPSFSYFAIGAEGAQAEETAEEVMEKTGGEAVTGKATEAISPQKTGTTDAGDVVSGEVGAGQTVLFFVLLLLVVAGIAYVAYKKRTGE